MGKKARMKGIRKIARELPVIMSPTQEKHFVLGAVLLEQGMRDIEGVPVLPTVMYEQMMPVMIAMNHERKMKQLFQQHGKHGVLAYINAVDQHLKEADV